MGGLRKMLKVLWPICSLFVAGGTAASETALPPGLIPAHATVVLLAGLPGDVESENEYREQLRTWIDLLADTPSEIFAFCDDPSSLNATHVPSLHLLKANRGNFLQLRERVAALTNALLFIAWGHGGRQGDTPVLHVRGPRITPEDFQTVAGTNTTTSSGWILLFRGSGSFASRLAGEHRQILSSERETMFNSDPIGMSVLLKMARGSQASSFPEFCEAFGLATSAWYKDRKLAQTEEPTLWNGTDKPRSLMPTLTEVSVASAKPQQGDEAKPGPESSTSELPQAWKGIKRVEPQRYPEADAVVLRRRLVVTLAEHPVISMERDEFIQVLTAEGKRFGDFDVSFYPPGEDISFLDTEVLRPDGKLARLDPDAIREVRDDSLGGYRVASRKFFSLPGVEPGAVLHVRYRTEWKEFPLPHACLDVPIDLELPLLEARVTVNVPKKTPLHFKLAQLPGADPASQESSYGTSYAWHFQNLAAMRHEPLVPPRDEPRLLLSTFPDWSAFSGWYRRITKLANEVTPELSAKAVELTTNSPSDQEKVLAAYNYVTRLRYVAIPLGINSFRPHAAANVLRNQFGDCKDKANLFNTLLNSMNIPADLVLVPRFGQANQDVPGLSFNHAISRVKLGGDYIWIDTTDDVCRFGMLPPGDAGRNVLVIDDQSDELSPLPSPSQKDHRLQIRGELDCSALGESTPATLQAKALGYPDYQLRTTARGSKQLFLIAVHNRPASGSFALDAQTNSAVSALDQDFCCRAEGSWLGLFSADSRTIQSPFWLPKEWDLAVNRRTFGLFLNQGYPLTLDEEMVLALPAGLKSITLPAVRENEKGPLRWKIEWARVDQNKLLAKFNAELERGEISAADMPVVQNELRALLAALSTVVNLPSQ
jgi:hypothetical protein